MHSRIHVIVQFTCLEDEDKYKDRSIVEVQVLKMKYRRNRRVRI